MLPTVARLRHREDFALAVRRGRRARRSNLVVHYLGAPGGSELTPVPLPPARIGFVVGKPVGNSVERHRVVRRLRHVAQDRLVRLPAGSRLVVRALPPAAGSSAADLARDLDAALDRVLGTAS